MKPVDFKQVNVTFAKDQKEYQPLPAFRDADGQVITCWKFTFMERLQILFAGRLWLRVMTFNKALQPLMPEVNNPWRKPSKIRKALSFWIWRNLSGEPQPFYENPDLKSFKAPMPPDGKAWRGYRLRIWNWAKDYLVMFGELTFTPTLREKF